MRYPATAMANSRTPLLTAQWRDLAMLNFEIDPGLLAARVPAGCELDAWDGRTFVSVVGFMFRDTRLIGIPIPFHRTFEEVNLRFYVRRRAADGWRRGVVFIKEIVPRFAIARMARALYNEPYVSLPMSHEIIDREASRSVRYAWRLCGVENFLSIDVEGESALIVDGSINSSGLNRTIRPATGAYNPDVAFCVSMYPISCLSVTSPGSMRHSRKYTSCIRRTA